jgi:hypothetical protein
VALSVLIARVRESRPTHAGDGSLQPHGPSSRVAVFPVVPAKESLTEGTTVLNATEAIRELRTVLQRAELAFRVEVVIRNVWAAVSLGYPQVRQ